MEIKTGETKRNWDRASFINQQAWSISEVATVATNVLLLAQSHTLSQQMGGGQEICYRGACSVDDEEGKVSRLVKLLQEVSRRVPMRPMSTMESNAINSINILFVTIAPENQDQKASVI